MSLVSVIGATGRQGLAQIRQLSTAGHSIRVLSRSAAPDLGPTNIEVETRHIDLYDPKTFTAAIEGSDAVFLNLPVQMNEVRQTLPALLGKASHDVGVKRFVWNTSLWIPDKPGDPYTYADNTVAINALWRSGVPATVFGSVLFMDNLLTDWARPFIMNENRYSYPHQPHLDANWISLDDVGKIMVLALERPDLEGAWMNIGGPERLLPHEVVEILSDVLGKAIKYDPWTPKEFGAYMTAALGDMPEEVRAAHADIIEAFYTYNNDAPTKPFRVNTEYMMERLPEMEFETMRSWAMRQDWSDNAHRPSGG